MGQMMRHQFAHRPHNLRWQLIARSAVLAALAAISFGSFVGTATAITVYNRTAAVAYANANYNKVVGDGYFYINSYPATLLGAGAPVPSGGNDCAHFVSSAIGSPPGGGGGGLTIPNRAGTYGEPGAGRLDALLVGDSAGGYGTTYKYGERVTSVSQLTPGDVIGYDWDGDAANGNYWGIDHTAIYIGNNQIDCHSNSRLGANWTLGGAANYFFIHITLPDAIVPTTPSNVSPAANALVADLTPTLTANAFNDGAIGSKHVAAQWQILNGLGIAVYDSGTDTAHLTSLSVPAGKLNVGSTYSWKVRYQDNYGGWSSYSTPTSLSVGIAGDYNHNGVVDAADYLVWSKNPTANGGADGYNTWRAHFGMAVASGTELLSADSTSAVPEPSAAALLLGLAILLTRSPRRARAEL
jgi:hypothetical protein